MAVKRNKKGQFIKGNQSRLGIKHTKETKKRIKLKAKKRCNSVEFQKKHLLGNKNPFYGRTHSKGFKETKKELYKQRFLNGEIPTTFKKGKHASINTEFKKGHVTPLRVRLFLKSLCGEKSPHWKGGISFEPYGVGFNRKLKRQIRNRDNHICQECRFTEKQLGYKLHVHHIDYNKKNNNPSNLISLCNSCHSKTNFNREDWIKHYQEKININIKNGSPKYSIN